MKRYARQLERFSMFLMVFGVIALCQPWNLVLHSYGATVILAGLILFNVFSRLKSPSGKAKSRLRQTTAD